MACEYKAPVSVVSALLAAHPGGEAAWLLRDGCGMGDVLFAPLVLFPVLCRGALAV